MIQTQRDRDSARLVSVWISPRYRLERQLPFITQKPPAHNLSLLRVHAEKTPIKIYGQWEDQRAFVPREASTPDVTHCLVTQ